MFMHNKRLQFTVRVSEPNPRLACMIMEQFGGADGELAAAMRYFTQGLGEDDVGRKDMLLDIATEELSHLEVIGSIVTMRMRSWRPARPSISGPRSTVPSNFTVTPFVSGAACSLLIVISFL